MRLLVVDDHPLVRAVAVDIFEEAGYAVVEATSAREALLILEVHDTITAVFTDIQMPGDMDGLGLVAAIHDRWPTIALLVTSGRIIPEAGQLPLGVGFIGKPYHRDDLLERIGAAIGSRTWRPAHND